MSLKSSQQHLSSEDPYFDDIRPCRDDEVAAELDKVLADKTVIDGILRFRFPFLSKYLPFLLRPAVKAKLRSRFSAWHSIADVQHSVAGFMRHMIATTTKGAEFKGFDKLDPKKGYLFISNHRDISLDPAFVDFALYENGHETVRIAIGDNLLKVPAVTSLMRLNKSFIVKRSVSSPREKLREIQKLSEYIGLSIKENHSVWIAQREGRTKDGDDKTDDAVLKMFYMHGRALGMSFKDYMQTLNIVPVSITYEYDPGDLAKARELDAKERNHGEYHKGPLEDIQSIVDGIKGFKGRVRLTAGEPIEGGFETPEELSALIDNFIWSNYALFPSTLLAAGAEDAKIDEESRRFFAERLNSYPEQLRERVRSTYAKPYENYLKARGK